MEEKKSYENKEIQSKGQIPKINQKRKHICENKAKTNTQTPDE